MPARFTMLSAADLRAALRAPRAPVVVDVRDAGEFERAHVPGSRHVPLHDLGARRAELPANLAERVVLVGDDAGRTAAAANFLALIGFGDVGLLDGGIAAWDGPLETGPPPARRQGPELRTVD